MTDAKNESIEGCVVDERYRVDRHLKLNVFKSSYSCVDLYNDQKSIVLKTIHLSSNLSETYSEWSRNLSLRRRLRHPHLARIVDFGITEDSGKLYFVEEWITGKDLFSGTDGMGVEEMLHLLSEIFQSVSFLHRRGIIHGNLKPSNIFIISDENGSPHFKLTDFGLFRSRPALDLGAVESGGMLSYTAPEILLGGSPDAASDMYSLGILTYLLLTRRLPFEDSDPGFLIQKHLQGHADLQPLKHLKWAKNIIPLLQMLFGKEAESRPASLDEPISLLQKALKRKPIKRKGREEPDMRLSATHLIGREDEMFHLQECADRVSKTGRGWTVFVSGEAGSGKTRCLEELKYWGRMKNWRVIEGTCNIHEEGSYSPFRRILSMTQSDRQEDIFHYGQSLLREGSGIFKASLDYAAGQFRDILTRELVRHLTQRPTLLLLDDFHEADEATAMVLDYLSADIQAHPVLMCVGLRSGEESGSALNRIINLAVRQKRGQVIALEALAEESVCQILNFMTGAPGLKDTLGSWIYRHVGGNPFFLEEMLKHLFEQGLLTYVSGQWLFNPKSTDQLEVPDSVGVLIKQRLDRLKAQSRETARWLALINRPVSARFLRKVAPLDFSQISSALKELVDRQMVLLKTKEKEEMAEFRHALIGEVLRSRISKKKRQKMHGRIAEELEKESGSTVHLQELARHSMEGKLDEKAVRYALALATRSRMEFSHEVAANCFEYVLDERSGLGREELCRVSIDAADTMIALGLPGRAIRRLKAEVSRNRKIDRDLKGRMFMQLALSCQHQGDFSGQQDYCRRGLRLFYGVPLSEKKLTRAMLYAELAFGAAVQSHPRQGLVFLQKAIKSCPDTGSEALSGRIQSIAAFLHRVACDLHQALVSSQKATSILSRTDECYLACSAFSTLGFILMSLGRFGPALETHRQAVGLSDRSRAVIPRAQALGNLAECLCRMGQIQQARKALDKAMHAAEESGNPAINHALNTIMAEVMLAENDYGAACHILSRISEGPGDRRALYAVGHAYYIAALLHFTLGNFRAADDFIRMLQRMESSEAPCYEYELAEALQARILFEQNNVVEAVNCLNALDRTVTRKRWPYQQAFIKLHLAEILTEKGDFGEAGRHTRNALRLARAMQSEYLVCYSRLLSGRLHVRQWQNECRTSCQGASEFPDSEDCSELQKAEDDLKTSVKAAEHGGHREIAWRAHAELCVVYGTLQNKDERLRHARAAYECLCKLENQVPGEMLATYQNAFNRHKVKAELARIIESAQYGPAVRSTVASDGHDLDHSRILSRVSATFNTIGDLEPLLEAILDQLIQALVMERALVYLEEDPAGKLRLAKGRSNSGENIEATVLQYILEEVGIRGNPVVSAHVGRDSRFKGQKWPPSIKPGRLLCAPLKVSGRTIGLLYTDHSLPAESLNESAINLFAAFCNLSAIAINSAIAHQKLVKEKVELERYLHQNREPYKEIVGGSPAAEALRDRIAIVAATPLDVLITGESGTGKELVAKAIYRTCRRSSGKFIPVDCGSLSDNLAEAELFGYRKGSFTGATENRQGLLESANGGILFLDEVLNLPLKLQPKFLRVLEEREIRRVGETVTRKIDIQVIAATNRDLSLEVKEGRFRNDLYFRLKKMDIRVPPLRERRDDIPMLVHFFLEKWSEKEDGLLKSFSSRAMSILKNYSYPGNIRELNNIVSRAFYSAAGNIIDVEDLPPELYPDPAEMSESEPDLAAQLYRDILKGKGSFQDLIKVPFLNHKFDVTVMREVIRIALKDARGRYRDAFERLRIPNGSYAANLQFLKRHGCYLDFRPFR